jgi:hypothetical protein
MSNWETNVVRIKGEEKDMASFLKAIQLPAKEVVVGADGKPVIEFDLNHLVPPGLSESCMEAWGSPSGAFHVEIDWGYHLPGKFQISFDSKGQAAIELILRISALFPSMVFGHMFVDEQMLNFGWSVYHNGVEYGGRYNDSVYEYGGKKEGTRCLPWPQTPKDALAVLHKTKEWKQQGDVIEGISRQAAIELGLEDQVTEFDEKVSGLFDEQKLADSEHPRVDGSEPMCEPSEMLMADLMVQIGLFAIQFECQQRANQVYDAVVNNTVEALAEILRTQGDKAKTDAEKHASSGNYAS